MEYTISWAIIWKAWKKETVVNKKMLMYKKELIMCLRPEWDIKLVIFSWQHSKDLVSSDWLVITYKQGRRTSASNFPFLKNFKYCYNYSCFLKKSSCFHWNTNWGKKLLWDWDYYEVECTKKFALGPCKVFYIHLIHTSILNPWYNNIRDISQEVNNNIPFPLF